MIKNHKGLRLYDSKGNRYVNYRIKILKGIKGIQHKGLKYIKFGEEYSKERQYYFKMFNFYIKLKHRV